MRRVIVESPYKGNLIQRWFNRRYARACLHDCLRRGEAPFASHLLYTQPGVLRDGVALEREQGIRAGLAWGGMGASDRGLHRSRNLCWHAHRHCARARDRAPGRVSQAGAARPRRRLAARGAAMSEVLFPIVVGVVLLALAVDLVALIEWGCQRVCRR